MKPQTIEFIVWSNGWHKLGVTKLFETLKQYFDNESFKKFCIYPIDFMKYDRMDKNCDEYRKLEYEYKQWKTNVMINKINGDF